MTEPANDLIVEKKYPALEDAQRYAGAEAANTGAFSFPVVIFRQGNRTSLAGALPMSLVRSRLESRSASRQGAIRDTQSSWNRPEDPRHSQAIADYLIENSGKNYIMPPLTLNIQQRVHLYTVDYPSEFRPGYLVIPATARLAITDGQHRRSAIISALVALERAGEEQAARFGSDAIAIMITCEMDISQIHQDFADCSKTKALPPSLLAVYDRRNPGNRLVLDLEKECPLFAGRIDSTSKTLSKKSTFLFLANQLRQLVKELLAGSYARPDVEFEKIAVERLSTKRMYEDALQKYSGYINHLTQVIPVWNDIANLPTDTLEASQIPGKRDEGWICLKATGLNLIGRVGHELFKMGEKNWREYADRLGRIDWSRGAQIWQGNIVMGTRIMNQQVPLRRAFTQVCEEIGWSLDRQVKRES